MHCQIIVCTYMLILYYYARSRTFIIPRKTHMTTSSYSSSKLLSYNHWRPSSNPQSAWVSLGFVGADFSQKASHKHIECMFLLCFILTLIAKHGYQASMVWTNFPSETGWVRYYKTIPHLSVLRTSLKKSKLDINNRNLLNQHS